jgi:ABC-type nitrate/sulfonate/bicarbonate transport system permease component
MPRALVAILAWSLKLAAALVVLALLWQAAVTLFKVPPYLIPAPGAVWSAFVEKRASIAEHAGLTLMSAGLGLVVSCVLAIVLSVVFVMHKAIGQASMPLVIAFRSAPVTAIAPIIMLFVGRDMGTSVVVVVIVSFFPVMVNLMRGLRDADVLALELMHVYGATRWQQIWMVRAPSSLPFLFTGLRVAGANAILGALLAEWITGSPGLGLLILESGDLREVELLWAAVLVTVAIALAVFAVTSAAEKAVLQSNGNSNLNQT